MTRTFPGPTSKVTAVFMVVEKETPNEEYPTGPENQKSTTATNSIFDDGTGTLLPSSYWGGLRVAVPEPAVANAGGSTAVISVLQHDGTTLYPGLAFTHTFILATAGAGLSRPGSWPVEGYIGRQGISVRTSADAAPGPAHIGIVSFLAYNTR